MTRAWAPLGRVDLKDHLLEAPWLLAVEDLDGLGVLRIRAEAAWSLRGMFDCGADGTAGTPAPLGQRLVASAALAALVGRIGGSTADLPQPAAAASVPFAVGSYCEIAIPAGGAAGPLFLSVNLLIRPIHVTRLSVTIDGAPPSAAPSAPPEAVASDGPTPLTPGEDGREAGGPARQEGAIT